ncbi:MAG: FHA domain-containing protein [Ectothiorhodospiraceae bacterium]|nr:FHA domain-containing protein [Ectothiorhodospiraceae bacterium]
METSGQIRLILSGREFRIAGLRDLDRVLGPMLAAAEPAAEPDRAWVLHLARRVEELMAQLVANPHEVSGALARLDADSLGGEVDWANVFAAVASATDAPTEMGLLALSRYRAYLLARLGVTGNSVQELDSLRETSTVGAGAASAVGAIPGCVRIPRGRAVALALVGMTCEVWLGGHRFVLRAAARSVLEDPGGRAHALREGRNLIGRARYNDVVVDADWISVSRRHLILDLAGGRPVAVTDLSSRGTFVAREALSSLRREPAAT